MSGRSQEQPPATTAAGDALFVLSALGMGGSERKIARITASLAVGGLRVGVCALGPPYTLRPALHAQVASWTLDRRHRVSPRVLRSLRALVREQRPRTVIAVDLFALLHVQVALRGAGASRPQVVALINTTTFVRRRDRLFMLGYVPLLRAADLLVFGSARQRQEWLQRYRLGATATRVVHNGVDAVRFVPASVQDRRHAREALSIPAGRIVLGTVGRLAPEKNQIALVRALAALCAAGLDAHLLLAGDGPMREAIVAEARRLDLTARLTLAGEVDDVRTVLAALDTFVLPSTSVETFSNAALEAMASGLPVVLTDIGGAREMITDGCEGYIVPPADQAALEAALRALCGDAALLGRAGAAARARVEGQFAFDTMVSVYRAIIAAPTALGASASMVLT